MGLMALHCWHQSAHYPGHEDEMCCFCGRVRSIDFDRANTHGRYIPAIYIRPRDEDRPFATEECPERKA